MAPPLDVQFAELEGAADALLIGFPDLVKWDTRFYEDADHHRWVEFKRYGFTVPVCKMGH